MCAQRETQFVRQHEISLSDPPNYLHPAKTLVSQLLSILILRVEAVRTVPINNSRFNYGGITPHIEKLPVLCLIPLILPYLFTVLGSVCWRKRTLLFLKFHFSPNIIHFARHPRRTRISSAKSHEFYSVTINHLHHRKFLSKTQHFCEALRTFALCYARYR